MTKVGIYCRISIEDKNKPKKDDSRSIQNQKDMLCDYCKKNKWEIYDIYCDDGYSGIDGNRPEFRRLINDCEQKKIDIVLCKDQSRFSRDVIVIEEYINGKFLEWGTRFIGVADNADSESEIYGTMRLFTSAYNEMYVKDISAKIRRTLSYKREKGQFIGSFAPYGYITDPCDKHHLIIDKEAAEVVKMIFDMYIKGNGYRKIVQELNNRHILNPSAYKSKKGSNYVNSNLKKSNSENLWTQSTIHVILRNEMYTGAMIQGKSHNISYKNKKRKKIDEESWVKIPDTHEAIIDSDTWEKTQERLNSRTRAGRTSNEISALSGKVKCAVCSRPMKRNVYYNKSKTIRYYGLQCATYKTGCMNCTNKKTISGKILESKIIDELNGIVEKFLVAEKINMDNLYVEQIEISENQLELYEKEYQKENERIEQLYLDKLDKIITKQEYIKYSESFRNKISEISRNIEDLKENIKRLESESKKNQHEIIEKYTRFGKIDRTLADEFIDYIEIGEADENGNRNINIYWKI